MSDPSENNSSSESRKPAARATPDKADALRALPSVNNVAVALRHDRSTLTLPRIVASGRGAVAEQIVAVAQAQGIRVSKDADLAEVLVALEVGSDIPVEAFAAVAEILSYIYRANKIHGTAQARVDHSNTSPPAPQPSSDRKA